MSEETKNNTNELLHDEPTNYKVSDADFWNILRENGGLFSQTARAITETLGIGYTRQSVKARAENYPTMLQDIRESVIDVAENGLQTLCKSENEPIKFQACKYVASTLGKTRGFTEKTEVEHSGEIKTITTIREVEVKSAENL